MIENIAIISGVSALVVAIIAVVVLLLLKKNVKDILSKDSLIFDHNFELKKAAINQSFGLIDEIEIYGKVVTTDANFAKKAKACYNELLCVVSNPLVVQEFYNIAMNTNYNVSKTTLDNYKLMCRKDIGLKAKNIKIVPSYEPVGTNQQMYQNNVVNNTQPTQPKQTNTTVGGSNVFKK